MSANLSRNYKTEMNAFAGHNVIIETTNGKKIKGLLIGLNADDMSMILGDAIVNDVNHHRLFLSGKIISEMYLGEAPFNIAGLKTALEEVFKKSGVKYYDDTQTIVVMDRYKVKEGGVEGEGPIADRIRRIWQSHIDQYKTDGPSE
ncbi:MAG: Lsm family RNA-binding protein [Asgard group archaeon]|jgi:small nuclear ribonucleoprotein (snRNP)-like protein|nr:Lsm family RNA-binding protein [Asgard group archaeon]|tara:strand:- start:1294 stop:1731 length:438 start_codon:yes stop_codon:yes gene_type:complete